MHKQKIGSQRWVLAEFSLPLRALCPLLKIIDFLFFEKLTSF